MTRQIDSLRRNRALFDRAFEKAHGQVSSRERGLERVGQEGFGATPVEVDRPAEALRGALPLESLGSAEEVRTFLAIEAIILAEMRPAWFILGDAIEIDGDYDRIDLVRERKTGLEAILRSVGRVDLIHHPTLPYAGTGWLIDDDIVVTNRHVAEVFAERSWTGGYGFATGVFGERMEARLDTVRQRDPGTLGKRAVDVLEVLYVAGPREPDFAFLKVAKRDDLPKLDLASALAEPDQPVAAIGYPASDAGRNDPELMNKLFKGVYDVKRFSPGLVTARREDDVLVLADYSSLGGSSGSAILDIDTGKVVGLHFAGVFRDANYAVDAGVVKAALARVRTSVAVPGTEVELPPTPPEAFAGRRGYDPGFLGDGDLAVPLPTLGTWAGDVAPVTGDPDGILRYTHFSTIQSASRRLPLVTAVNIDGERSFELKRRGEWRLDGRLAREHQIGNELYANNPFDRGHMVRRRDPGWGADREEAQSAEIDTFHYTNSAPQHEDLNQRDWSGLEDYILGAAETRGFRLSVFTGPVFRDSDRHLRPQVGSTEVAIPEEFWKIAVMIDDDTGQLSATGYVLSQGRMIRPLTEAAFVLGEYATYQVQIALIERETGLDFGRLRDFDPLGPEPESLFGRAAIRVEGPESLRLAAGGAPRADGPQGQPPADLEAALREIKSIMSASDAEKAGAEEAPAGFGHYVGLPPRIELLADGRLARLLSPLSYVAANGVTWPVPKGARLDGASIPRAFWSLIGGPFEGRYRDASIVHDHYCVVRSRSWQATHRMFYAGMRCSGVGEAQAKTMFYAVYRFGPRWPGAAEAPGLVATSAPRDADAASLVADARRIVEEDPSLEEIEAIADASGR